MRQIVTDCLLAIFTQKALHEAGADLHPAIGSPTLGPRKSIGIQLGRKSGLKKLGRVIQDSQPSSAESEEASE